MASLPTTLYDLMLESDATSMLMLPFYNYFHGNHDAIREMLTHPAGVVGLSDGGAHCGMICDASYPTFLLTHWARGRHGGEKLPLEYVVRKQSHDTAQLFGLSDRGVIEVGKSPPPSHKSSRATSPAGWSSRKTSNETESPSRFTTSPPSRARRQPPSMKRIPTWCAPVGPSSSGTQTWG
jgi:hypothetical protein